MIEEFETTEFDEIVKDFPSLFNELILKQKNELRTLVKSKVQAIFNKKEPIHGIYLISDKCDNPIYVGRSRNMQVRIGVDHRALTKTQANLMHKLARELNLSPAEAREYMYLNYYVRMIEINNDYARTLFEVYTAMKLKTPYNSFRET